MYLEPALYCPPSVSLQGRLPHVSQDGAGGLLIVTILHCTAGLGVAQVRLGTGKAGIGNCKYQAPS